MSGIINSAGSRSGIVGTTELDYEEGTWTPSNGSWAVFSRGTYVATTKYVKIGRLVTVWYQGTGTGEGSAGQYLTQLPFIPTTEAGAIFTDSTPTQFVGGMTSAGTAHVTLVEAFSSDDVRFTCTYYTSY